MSKKDDDLSPLLNNLNDSIKSVAVSSETKEAMEAIELTSKIMDAIMSGKQLDLAYYKFISSKTIEKLKKKKKK